MVYNAAVAAAVQVRMSWCLMQEKVIMMGTDIEDVYRRVGGRGHPDKEEDPLIKMTDMQVLSAYYEGHSCCILSTSVSYDQTWVHFVKPNPTHLDLCNPTYD